MVTFRKTAARGLYVVLVDGGRIGTVEKSNGPLWSGQRWQARLDGVSTRFDCDGQGHRSRDSAAAEMARFAA